MSTSFSDTYQKIPYCYFQWWRNRTGATSYNHSLHELMKEKGIEKADPQPCQQEYSKSDIHMHIHSGINISQAVNLISLLNKHFSNSQFSMGKYLFLLEAQNRKLFYSIMMLNNRAVNNCHSMTSTTIRKIILPCQSQHYRRAHL